MAAERGVGGGLEDESDFACRDVAGRAKVTMVRCGLLGGSVVTALRAARVTYRESNNPFLDVVLPGDLACMYVSARQLESFDRLMQEELRHSRCFSLHKQGKDQIAGPSAGGPVGDKSLKDKLEEIKRHKHAAICIEKSKSANSSMTISMAQLLFVVKLNVEVIPVADSDGFTAYLMRKLSPQGERDKKIKSTLNCEPRKALGQTLASELLLQLPGVQRSGSEKILNRFRRLGAFFCAEQDKIQEVVGDRDEATRLYRLFRCSRGHHNYAIKCAKKANAAAKMFR